MTSLCQGWRGDGISAPPVNGNCPNFRVRRRGAHGTCHIDRPMDGLGSDVDLCKRGADREGTRTREKGLRTREYLEKPTLILS